MTRAFFPLFANNLRVMFTTSKDDKQKKKNIAIYTVLAVLMLPILGVICYSVYSMARVMPIEVLPSIIASVMFMTEIVVLFFGIQSAIGMLFSSKDTEFLMALPVKSLDIFLSKFATIYVLHLGLALLMQLPIFLSIGIGASIKSATYYILGLLGSFLSPFIPLFIMTILAVPVGYLVSYFKKNNLAGTIVVLLLFAGFFGGYLYLIFAMQNTANFDPNAMQKALEIMSYIIYPNLFIAEGMMTNGLTVLKDFAIFFAIILGLAVVTIAISGVLYKRSVRGNLESGVKKSVKAKENRVKSPIYAMLTRDVKSCLSETSSSVNYLIGLILVPIMIIMFGLIYKGTPGGSMAVMSSVSSVAIIFGCGMNYLAIVAFSREGRQMDLLKMLPVSDFAVIKQKLLLSNIYTFIISIIIFACSFVASLHYMYNLMIFATLLLAGFAINIMVMCYDLKSPNFAWNNAKELFKNNSKSLVSMVITLPLLIVNIASSVCITIFAPDMASNILLYNFMLAVPSLALALIYFAIAIFVVMPKLKKLYADLEI